jgi:hypothetical protein
MEASGGWDNVGRSPWPFAGRDGTVTLPPTKRHCARPDFPRGYLPRARLQGTATELPLGLRTPHRRGIFWRISDIIDSRGLLQLPFNLRIRAVEHESPIFFRGPGHTNYLSFNMP